MQLPTTGTLATPIGPLHSIKHSVAVQVNFPQSKVNNVRQIG